MRVVPAIDLTEDQQSALTTLARYERISVCLARRAQTVVLAAQGFQNKDIHEQLGFGRAQLARCLEDATPGHGQVSEAVP